MVPYRDAVLQVAGQAGAGAVASAGAGSGPTAKGSRLFTASSVGITSDGTMLGGAGLFSLI